MHQAYKKVRECVRTYPLPLLDLTDKKLISYANSLLPFDVGIEVECMGKEEYRYGLLDHKSLKDIRFIKGADHDRFEKRFRIPSGIKGLVCLYDVSIFLKNNCLVNPGSGIHYHIDCTDYPKVVCPDRTNHSFIRENQDWILKSLLHWGYKGTYNVWRVSWAKSAVRFDSSKKTIEFRIGESTFEYDLLVKRILNCQNIVKLIKKKHKQFLSEESLKEQKTKLDNMNSSRIHPFDAYMDAMTRTFNP